MGWLAVLGSVHAAPCPTSAEVQEAIASSQRSGTVRWEHLDLHGTLRFTFEPDSPPSGGWPCRPSGSVELTGNWTMHLHLYSRKTVVLDVPLRGLVQAKGASPADWFVRAWTERELVGKDVPTWVGAMAWEEGEDPQWPPTLSVTVDGLADRPAVVIWRTTGEGRSPQPWLIWVSRP